ncbi:hypothetical protein Hanom_Chr17g01551961 [Helianthus anomalus]
MYVYQVTWNAHVVKLDLFTVVASLEHRSSISSSSQTLLCFPGLLGCLPLTMWCPISCTRLCISKFPSEIVMRLFCIKTFTPMSE